jgi:hypothetical protein
MSIFWFFTKDNEEEFLEKVLTNIRIKLLTNYKSSFHKNFRLLKEGAIIDVN